MMKLLNVQMEEIIKDTAAKEAELNNMTATRRRRNRTPDSAVAARVPVLHGLEDLPSDNE